jgi:hypothetical protein
MRTFPRIIVCTILLIAYSVGGCKTFKQTGQNPSRLHVTEFMQRLSQQGITAREEGPVSDTTILSTFGERLLLNERDLVDVYFFREEEQARMESNVAETLALYDVYQGGNIVLIHRTSYDPSVRNALENMFGLPK